jgi:hypothetical protein
MKLNHRNLKLNLTGDDVRLLQSEFVQIGLTIPKSEQARALPSVGHSRPPCASSANVSSSLLAWSTPHQARAGRAGAPYQYIDRVIRQVYGIALLSSGK